VLYIYGKLNSTEFYDNGGPLDPPDPNWILMVGYPPAVSGATPPNPYFEYRAQTNGTWLEFAIPAPARVLVVHDGKLKTVSCIYLGTDFAETSVGALPSFAASQRRRTRKDITIGANGVGTIDITPPAGQPPYAVAPDIDPIVTTNASGTVTYVPKVSALSTTSLSVTAVRTKGTLLLTAGPIEAAVAGDVVSVWIIEK